MPLYVMDMRFARAAAADAANRQMRAEGRTFWNADDYDLAVRTFHRLMGYEA